MALRPFLSATLPLLLLAPVTSGQGIPFSQHGTVTQRVGGSWRPGGCSSAGW